ncbi:MAG TPA: PAS domain-containing sensor histidine kinase [Terriglobales bacterium]|nr:PAS domain-containing sensor histidine kinase [Terriglobales bacterium]
MRHTAPARGWFWATLALSSLSLVALVFAFWELVENRFFRDLDYVSLHYLYISRGIASSILLAAWAAWLVMRERRAAEEELSKSRERYRGLLDASPGAVALFGADLRVLEWNASAERLYGYQRDFVLELPVPTVPPQRRAELAESMARVQRGEAVLDQESERVDASGQLIQVQLSLLPFHEGGELFYLEVAADIRERVRLRERLIEFEKLTSMGQMAAGTAHHLNTPLAAMLLRVQMMRGRMQEPATAEELERLEGSLRFCQQFVQRLLDFSRRPTMRREPEPVRAVIEGVLAFIGPTLQAKQVRLGCELNGIGGQRVLGDRNELETLLLILLSNAADAVEKGGRIGITVQGGGENVEISISDDGCGIPAESLPRIFEPFYTTKPVGKGTGLGLAIAKNIVSQHGGSIRLESGQGRGTRAIVQLPALAATAVPA